MKKGIFLLCLFLSGTCVFSQKKAQDIDKKDLEKLILSEDSLAHWARIAVTNSILDRRIEAQDKILPLIRKTLAISNSFNYPFSELENVSITYPQDRSFRIFTWQLMHTDMNYQYFGFIQLNSSKSVVYELKDFSKSLQKPESQITTQDKWFGAIYYSIRDFKTKDGDKYLLFGLNSNDTIEKIKLCDVLTLSKGLPSERGGQIKFGAPVFEKNERGRKKMVNRLMMYHAKDAVMRFNYDAEMDMIVHDHLTDVPSPTPKVPFVSVPDGTYEAYTLKKGIWQHIDKLATTEMDEAPIPIPVLGKKARVVDKENAKSFYGHEELPQKATEEKKKETKQ